MSAMIQLLLSALATALSSGVSQWDTTNRAKTVRKDLYAAYDAGDVEKGVKAARQEPASFGPWTGVTLGVAVIGLITAIAGAALGNGAAAIIGGAVAAAAAVGGGISGMVFDQTHLDAVARVTAGWPALEDALKAEADTTESVMNRSRMKRTIRGAQAIRRQSALARMRRR